MNVSQKTDEWLARGYDLNAAIAFAVAGMPLPSCPASHDHYREVILPNGTIGISR